MGLSYGPKGYFGLDLPVLSERSSDDVILLHFYLYFTLMSRDIVPTFFCAK